MATWKVMVEAMTTAEASNTTYFQGIKPTNNIILTGLRATILQYNNPSWSSVTMKLHSYSGNAVRGLIASATRSYSKADLFSDPNGNGFASGYFPFDNIPIKAGDTIAAVMNVVSYTGTDTEWVGWVVGWPDPIYRTGITVTYENLLTMPYSLEVIGYEL